MPDRRFSRVKLETQAQVRIGDQLFMAMTENLSLNGLYVRTEEQAPLGKRASISMNLPSVSNASYITVDGEVVRSDLHGMAFQFKSLNFDQFSHLKTVVNRKASLRVRNFYLA